MSLHKHVHVLPNLAGDKQTADIKALPLQNRCNTTDPPLTGRFWPAAPHSSDLTRLWSEVSLFGLVRKTTPILKTKNGDSR